MSSGTAADLSTRSFFISEPKEFAHLGVVKGTHRSTLGFDAHVGQLKTCFNCLIFSKFVADLVGHNWRLG